MKLSAIADEDVKRCAGISAPFQGDSGAAVAVVEKSGVAPAVDEEGAEEAGEEGVEPGFTKVLVTEETRLAYAVAAIDFAAAVVPKGAMMMDSNEAVVPNRSFAGLEVSADCHAPNAPSRASWETCARARQ